MTDNYKLTTPAEREVAERLCREAPPMMPEYRCSPCRPCMGTGRMPGELLGERCPYCNGDGFVPECAETEETADDDA